MKNPLSVAMAKARIKPIDLAKQLHMSRQYISKAELGCSLNLNGPLARWTHSVLLEEFPKLSINDVQAWYHSFQNAKRLHNFQKNLLEMPEFPSDTYAHRNAFTTEISNYPSSSLSRYQKKLLDHIPQQRVMTLQEAFNNPPVASRPNPGKLTQPRNTREAFINWRKKYWATTYAFASEMCVSPSNVDNYESGTVKEMPADLRMFMNWLREAVRIARGE